MGASIQTLLIDLARIKALQDELAAEKANVQGQLSEALIQKGQKTLTATLDGGEQIIGTLVQAQRVTYDADRLKNALDARQWGKVTTQVLDKAKLEAAVVSQVVDANVVASCASVADNAPYIKVSGTYSPKALVDPPKGDVSVKDAQGREKPAAKRVRKPKR
jgi:hypothetical protein